MNWSTTVSTRNQRPSSSRLLTKSMLKRSLGLAALSSGTRWRRAIFLRSLVRTASPSSLYSR